jgi:hypothetical protein
MQVYFQPVQFIDVAPRNKAKRDALLRGIERIYYDFIPPGDTDDDGKTHEEQQAELAKAQAALEAMKVRATPAAPRVAIEQHVSFYTWLSDNGFLASFDAAMPCPDPSTVFAIADAWQQLLIALLPVDDDQGAHAEAAAEVIDAMREWAARGLSIDMHLD